MRNIAKILIPALVIIAMVVSCALMFASAAGTPAITDGVEGEVIFIANEAKGDGSGRDADNAMGNDADYNQLGGQYANRKTAFWKALTADNNAIINNGGVIVICGEFTIDTADAQRTSFAEFQWPSVVGTKNITITSCYDGVDYRTQGAKLVLDTSKYAINWCIKAPSTWEYLNIEAKYDSTRQYGAGDNGVAMISFCGNKAVIDEEVVVTANDIGGSLVKYPALCAFDRCPMNVSTINTNLTINSGSWSNVFGASYGLVVGQTFYGASVGTVNITVNGGMVQNLFGTTFLGTTWTKGHEGDVNITLNGGEIATVVCSNRVGVGAGKINLTVSENVTGLTKVWAYDYTGNNDANAPTDAVITYNRSNLPDRSVKYFTTVHATGESTGNEPVYKVYISDNGTGDGSSPDKPLGNSSTYETLLNSAVESDRNKAYKQSAFYLAFEKLKSTGGKIIIVGDVSIEACEARIPTAEGQKKDPSEFTLPLVADMVTITSVDGTNDYRSQAKLIFDLDKCNTTFLDLMSPVTFKELNIEHRYDPDDLNSYKTPFVIGAYGQTLVIDEGVNVTSLNTDTNAPGDLFPEIMGGRRYSDSVKADITIKSGTWNRVILGGYGNWSQLPCNITGNAKLTVDGGKIGKIYATGSNDRPYGSIKGTVTINLNAGEIDRFYFSNAVEYPGTSAVITLGSALKINFADYAVRDYRGDIDELKTKVTFVNNTNLVIGQEPAREPDVIYVSDKGTGDGSAPDKPLGTDPGNVVATNSYKGTAFYKAMQKLTEYGGYIVVVGDTAINSADSRVEGKNQPPSELELPKVDGEVIITSVYKGVDYRNNAKFILDQDACAVTFVNFKSDVKFENINIEHRYDPNDINEWGTPMALAANGNKLVIEDTVKVTAWNVAKNMEGNWYPIILGGHRYANIAGNTNVTVKAGNWTAVYAGGFGMGASYPANVNGNATLNIEGGRIDTVYGTTDAKFACGKITGKLEINVTGGYVGAIFATQKNGAANEIVVNVAATAERVAKIWGGVSDASTPANGTVSYDRSVTRDDEVKYWSVVNVTGTVESQPEPVYFTLYVSDVEKGLGDGSSPENAIGHGEGYAQLRKKALSLIKAAGHDYNKLSRENQILVSSVYKQNALYRALSYSGNKMVNQGGKIIVCGTLTVDATDAMRNSLADFWGPKGAGEVTITSYDGKTNFRAKGAKLVLDNSELGLCVEFGSPTILDNLTIVHKYNSKNGKGISNGAIIAGMGNKLVIGYSVNVVATDVNPDEDARVEMYPTLLGGHRYADSKSDNYITVGSGQWAALIGGDFGSPHTGNATIGINGGKIGTVCGTINPTISSKKNVFDGSVWIGLWAGEVDNVYVVGKPGMIWGDASIGLGGTKVNGKVRATHPDYSGDEIQSWVFNYTDEQIDPKKVVGFENPVPETGSALPYLAVVATVSLVGVAALIVGKKKKAVKN